MTLFEVSKAAIGSLESRQHRYLVALLFSMLVAAIIETATLSLVAIYAATVSDPDTIVKSQILRRLTEMSGNLIPLNKRDLTLWLSLAVVLAVVFKNLLNSSLQYYLSKFAATVSGHIGENILRGLIGMRYEWHLGQNSTDLLNTFYWSGQIGNGVVKNLLQVCCDVLLVSFLFATLVFINPVVSLAVICFMGGAAWFIFKELSPRIDEKSNKNVDLVSSIAKDTMYIISGIKDVKLFGSAFKISNLSRLLKESASLQGSQAFLVRAPYDFLEVIGFLMITCSITGMNLLANSSSARITGTVTLIAVTAWRILPALNRIVSGFAAMRTALPMASRVVEHLILFEQELKGKGSLGEGQCSVGFKNRIECNELSFKYEGASICALSQIGFTVEKGETLGLVGPSGSGKSTTVDLLIGFLTPQQGKVLIDSIPLTDENRTSWMKMIGYVPQVPYISDDSLGANIAFGKRNSEVDREWVLECCKMANVDEFLPQLPMGIDTLIGERGVRLSGGQRQRVAIARALFKRPEIIILDEATSALDTKSERMIQTTILGLRGKITMIIIAHRLSTVEHCDRVLWLEKGRMRMFGKAEEVIPRYRHAY
jgi:ATP-binding cassette, subfamily B, bacterial PglK